MGGNEAKVQPGQSYRRSGGLSARQQHETTYKIEEKGKEGRRPMSLLPLWYIVI